ncbi:MAG: transcription antitermination factor NusB [bacterium]|nr:transcription antitermination factor NusB [bacterium]
MSTDERELSDSPRRRARELVLHGLYACEVTENDPRDVLSQIVKDESLSGKNQDYAKALFTKVRDTRDWSDQQLVLLATNWKLDRFAELDKIILRMAMTELRDMPDIPVRVVINEAIELAKKYSTSESASFINGILDSYVKKTEAQPES